MVEECVKISFSSEIMKVKEAIHTVLACFAKKYPEISGEELGDLKLIYSELLFNAVIHGNRKDASKAVYIMIEFNADSISSIIKDEGNGFDYFKELNKECSLDHLFSNSGRGLQLVESLTDALNFNDVGNEIKFQKKLLYSNKKRTIIINTGAGDSYDCRGLQLVI